jgi:8-oxo-dGTP diphosphatase
MLGSNKPFYGTFKEYLKERYEGPFVATDVIIRHNDGKKNGIVLIERKYPPHGIAIPGGMAEYMTLENNAIKEAREETGLDVILDSPNHPFCVFSEPNQDPRAFITSVCYTGEGYGVLKPHKDEDAKSARVYTNMEVFNLLNSGKLAFSHHKKILLKYLNSLEESL